MEPHWAQNVTESEARSRIGRTADNYRGNFAESFPFVSERDVLVSRAFAIALYTIDSDVINKITHDSSWLIDDEWGNGVRFDLDLSMRFLELGLRRDYDGELYITATLLVPSRQLFVEMLRLRFEVGKLVCESKQLALPESSLGELIPESMRAEGVVPTFLTALVELTEAVRSGWLPESS
jgi:hypothetical protein